jgi:hypothetical protein
MDSGYARKFLFRRNDIYNNNNHHHNNNRIIIIEFMSRDNSVGIATGYELDDQGREFESR